MPKSAVVYLFEGKKMGSSKNCFLTSGFFYLEVENIFMNIFAKTKIFSKIFWVVTLGHRNYRFMKSLNIKNLMLVSL